ncbi:MAG: hypothetical protein M2R45_01683 [Verrucomicrobia subdivision 3 bacterium]|nr:hypothetical protein [Limisphaerales bacterium]MCS1413422.1 hypothetical protein [Limisphaerales bacterium]
MLRQLHQWTLLPHHRSRVDESGFCGRCVPNHDFSINYGIKTGYNAAFIVDKADKDALVAEDPKSEELLKPILRGRDIKRYQAQWAELWLIYSYSGIEIDNYPAIKRHLLPHREALEKRTGGARRDRNGNLFVPYKWYELQVDYFNSGAYKQFMRDKLVWITLVESGRFAYDENRMYCLDSSFMMTGSSLKYLCALLNAELIRWFLQQVAPTSGMGTFQWKKVYVETIPIPKLSKTKQQPFIDLVDKILITKKADPEADTRKWEKEINRLTYDNYMLSKRETQLIEEMF